VGIELVVTIVVRGNDLDLQAPGGFRYVSEVFEEAGLRDLTDAGPPFTFWQRVRILRRALEREFGGRVAIRILNLWTPRGLVFCARHRLREFPCLVIGGHCHPLGMPLSEFVGAVGQALEQVV
jgi:hypothetical protein